MLNYTAILSFFADIDVDKKAELLDKAENAYHFVIKNSEGIPIESQASALWGLGYLTNQKYQQYPKKKETLSLLNAALSALQKIGNKYAVDTICATIEKIESQIANIDDCYSYS